MWELVQTIANWPIWNFLSIVLVVFVTQKFIAWRERRKHINEKQLQIYMDTIGRICDLYESALRPTSSPDTTKLLREAFEVMATFSIMGSGPVMEAFDKFSEFAILHILEQKQADEPTLRHLASNVTYAMCCEIHGERYNGTDCEVNFPSTLSA